MRVADVPKRLYAADSEHGVLMEFSRANISKVVDVEEKGSVSPCGNINEIMDWCI